MRNIEYLERRTRGTKNLPAEVYRVTPDSAFYIMPCHWHPECELIYVRSGRLRLTLNESSVWLESGDIAVASGGTLHSGEPEVCEYDCIVFDLDKLLKDLITEDIPKADGLSLTPSVIRSGEAPELAETVERLTDKVASLESICAEQLPYARLICRGIFAELLGMLRMNTKELPPVESVNRHSAQLKKAIRYIEEGYNRRITLSELAREAGVSPKYLCKLFTSVIGLSPVEYLNEYRIECACALLMNTYRPILDVAYCCGFNDQSYFIRLFRRKKNMTPGEYRKKYSLSR